MACHTTPHGACRALLPGLAGHRCPACSLPSGDSCLSGSSPDSTQSVRHRPCLKVGLPGPTGYTLGCKCPALPRPAAAAPIAPPRLLPHCAVLRPVRLGALTRKRTTLVRLRVESSRVRDTQVTQVYSETHITEFLLHTIVP